MFVRIASKIALFDLSAAPGVVQMTMIAQLLRKKGEPVHSVSPDDTVYDAIKKMATENIGSLVVLEGEKIPGIITERHYARNVALKGRTSPATRVRDIMETKVLYARPDQLVDECMALMNDKRIRHLPVVDRNKLVGTISIGDPMKEKIGDQKFIIEQLENYIQG